MKKIFISAGEISGDMHGSYLARELYSNCNEIDIYGFGSSLMKAEKVKIIADMSSYSGVGLVENLPAIIPMKNILSEAKLFFENNKIDLVILIDWQGFNFRLASYLKSKKITCFYYIGPQEWIWGFKNGIKKLINRVDHLFTIFQKEHLTYLKLSRSKIEEKVTYVGHPLLDILKKYNKSDVKRNLGVNLENKVIGIMPGSRRQEIDKLLPVFLEAVDLLREKYQESISFVLIIPNQWKKYLEKFSLNGFLIKTDHSTYYMQGCDLILSASGTVTLEACILDIPIIANYKLNQLSYLIAKSLINLKYFTLPNIILDKKVIPEFIQKEVNSENLFEITINFIESEAKKKEMLVFFSEIRSLLKPKGAIKTVAANILEFLYVNDN